MLIILLCFVSKQYLPNLNIYTFKEESIVDERGKAHRSWIESYGNVDFNSHKEAIVIELLQIK